MQTWSITLRGPLGVISTVDTGESQFVIGTETASEVFTVHGDGIAPRHAWVWIGEAGMQVEDLGGGTLVNGYQINERVQVVQAWGQASVIARRTGSGGIFARTSPG